MPFFNGLFKKIQHEKLQVEFLCELLMGDLKVSGLSIARTKRLVLETKNPHMLSLIYIRNRRAIVLHLNAHEEHVKHSTLDMNLQEIFRRNRQVEFFNEIFVETNLVEKNLKFLHSKRSLFIKHNIVLSEKVGSEFSTRKFFAFLPLKAQSAQTLPKMPRKMLKRRMQTYKLDSFEFSKKDNLELAMVKMGKALDEVEKIWGGLPENLAKIKHFQYALLSPSYEIKAVDEPGFYLILIDNENTKWKHAVLATTVRPGSSSMSEAERKVVFSKVTASKNFLKNKHNLDIERLPIYVTILRAGSDQSIKEICNV